MDAPRNLIKTYLLFIGIMVTSLNAAGIKERCIGVQPYKGVSAEHVKEAKEALQAFYQCEVRILPTLPLPKKAFINVKSPRYRADIILQILIDTLPEGIDHVIGLTASDISTTKYENWETKEIKKPAWKYEDWGVFGLGRTPGAACVVSTYRLKNGVSKEILNERLRKVVCHEIGHNLGLLHCVKSEKCFMRDGAESITTVDTESESMCGSCTDAVKAVK